MKQVSEIVFRHFMRNFKYHKECPNGVVYYKQLGSNRLLGQIDYRGEHPVHFIDLGHGKPIVDDEPPKLTPEQKEEMRTLFLEALQCS